MAETSTKPYMIRALYEWCCDNGYTPYLAVAVDAHTIVPRQHVKSGEIVLNVSPMATSRLTLGNDVVEFQARFSGVAQQISVPVGNISAIYARETGHGMAFEVSKEPEASDEDADPDAAGHGHDHDHGPGRGADDEVGNHAPASSVQSLRGSRRRGPRSVDHGDTGETEPTFGLGKASDTDSEGTPEAEEAGDKAANSRKRSTKAQGSADVIAFAAPSGASRRKKSAPGASSTTDADADESRLPAAEPGEDDNEDPPPADGGGQNTKGSKAKLTRVK